MPKKKDLIIHDIATFLHGAYGNKSYSDLADPRDIPHDFISSAHKIYNIIFKGD